MKLLLALIQINHVFCFVSYKFYTLYGAVPANEQQVQLIQNLTDFVTVDFWRFSEQINRPVEFIIGPDENSVFTRLADELGLNYTMHNNDVQSLFDSQSIKTYTRRKMRTFDWEHFYRIRDIYAWFSDLTNAYPNKCQIIKLGKTFENRDILAMKIHLKPNPRSVVIVEAGAHGREWIGPAVANYLISSILTAEEKNDKVMLSLAETYEWYIVPVLNPDGYEYSFTRDRMWRKNRRRFHDGKGVDINSNFGYHFGASGTNDHAASPRYCGTHAFSERETKLMADLVDDTSSMLEYYISLHAYGQYLRVPYPDEANHLDNYAEVIKMCEEVAAVIHRKRGTEYVYGNSLETVGYYSSGGSTAWVKKYHRVPYVVTVNLPDNGKFGFAIPPNQIKPTCEETIDGLKTFFRPRTPEFSKLRNDPAKCSSAFRPFNCDVIFLLSSFLSIVMFLH